MPHLVVSISGHGFGHVAQTAPIINLLPQRLPQLQLTVRSAVPLAYLRSRIHVPFDHLPSEGDIGMVMSSALDVHAKESCAAYRTFHADWNVRVEKEARLLRELGADMVFSNVGYLPLAGAQRAGITNVALCSLNWFDIYRHYCGDDTIAAQILSCYTNADAFLRTTPGMAMETLSNLIQVTPIANIGSNRRDELNRHLKLSSEEQLVLVSMGGIASRLPIRALAAYRRRALAGAGELARGASRYSCAGIAASEFQRSARQQRCTAVQAGIWQLRRSGLHWYTRVVR